jgi:hypothetical protein
MSRKKGGGGQPSNKSSKRKSEEIQSELEPKVIMGTQGEDKVQQLLEHIVAGQLQMTSNQQKTTQLLTHLIKSKEATMGTRQREANKVVGPIWRITTLIFQYKAAHRQVAVKYQGHHYHNS